MGSRNEVLNYFFCFGRTGDAAGGDAGGEDGFVVAAGIEGVADEKYFSGRKVKIVFYLF